MDKKIQHTILLKNKNGDSADIEINDLYLQEESLNLKTCKVRNPDDDTLTRAQMKAYEVTKPMIILE